MWRWILGMPNINLKIIISMNKSLFLVVALKLLGRQLFICTLNVWTEIGLPKKTVTSTILIWVCKTIWINCLKRCSLKFSNCSLYPVCCQSRSRISNNSVIRDSLGFWHCLSFFELKSLKLCWTFISSVGISFVKLRI